MRVKDAPHFKRDEQQYEETVKQLHKFDDWYVTCPKCAKSITGTLAELGEHRCGK